MATLQQVKTSYNEIKKEGFDAEKTNEWIEKQYAPFVGAIISRLTDKPEKEFSADYIDVKSEAVHDARLRANSSLDAFQKLVSSRTSTKAMAQYGSAAKNAKAHIGPITSVYELLAEEKKQDLKAEVDFSEDVKKEIQAKLNGK